MPQQASVPELKAPPSRRSVLWALLALSWLLPLAVLGGAGWRSWQIDKSQATERIRATLRTVEEHIHDALDTQTLVLDWAQDRTAGLSWDDIEHSRPLYELLAALDRNYDQVDGIFLVDRTGRVRMNDHQFPLQRNIELADRDYFQALAKGNLPLFVSAPYVGRWNGSLSFRIARPRLAADGSFDGLIAVAVHVSYFDHYFKTVIGTTQEAVALMRRDGLVLARYPEVAQNTRIVDWRALNAGASENLDQVRRPVSTLDGISRLVGTQRVAGYPLVLSYGIDCRSLQRRWFADFALYGGVALVAALVLSAVTFLAILGERRQGAAIALWQDEQQQRLKAEADARRLGKYEALGTLAGGIAHHFNNLFPAFTGHLEIAIAEAGAGSPASPRLQRLLQEIDSARKIVRNILLYSRRDLSSFGVIDLSTVAMQVVDMCRASISTAAALQTEIAPGVRIMGEPTQIGELIANLLRNASDALEGKPGGIMLSVKTVPGARQAELVCADTGCGMPPEVVERAFDPFFTTKPPGSGSGLGLAICFGIIRSHDASISIDSAVGHGTRIIAHFPLVEQEAA